MRKRVILFCALVVTALLGASAAWASIPGPDGVIHGCYKTGNPNPGSLIIIDSAASCPNGYAALNWQQQNLAGREIASFTGTLNIPVGSFGGTAVSCPTGKIATGGGGEVQSSGSSKALAMRASFPLESSGQVIGWQAHWQNLESTDMEVNVIVYAICATP